MHIAFEPVGQAFGAMIAHVRIHALLEQFVSVVRMACRCRFAVDEGAENGHLGQTHRSEKPQLTKKSST